MLVFGFGIIIIVIIIIGVIVRGNSPILDVFFL